MVCPRFFPETGGIEMHAYQVSQRLMGLGHSVTLLTSDRSRQLPRQEMIEGIPVKRVPAWPRDRDYYFAPGVFSQVLRADYDVLHVQSYHSFVPPIAMMAALRANKPYVITFHGGGAFP